MLMLKDIVEVKALGGHRLYLRFEDGVAGQLDFAHRLRFDGVFQFHAEIGSVSEQLLDLVRLI